MVRRRKAPSRTMRPETALWKYTTSHQHRSNSALRRADQLDHGLRLGTRLDEVVGLRRDALAERLAVAFDHADSLFRQCRERFLLDREPMRSRISRGLLRRVEETVA